MAAIPISKNHKLGIVYLWTKFHACFVKATILHLSAALMLKLNVLSL